MIIGNIYLNNDNRLVIGIKENNKWKVESYPKFLIEQHLGRKLEPNEEVHHKDRNPFNNDISNLQVLTKKEHIALHIKEDSLIKYFDKKVVCPECGKEFLWTAKQQRKFYQNRNKHTKYYSKNVSPFCSKRCGGIYGARIQNQNKGFDTIHFNVNKKKKKKKIMKDSIIFNSKSVWKYGYKNENKPKEDEYYVQSV